MDADVIVTNGSISLGEIAGPFLGRHFIWQYEVSAREPGPTSVGVLLYLPATSVRLHRSPTLAACSSPTSASPTASRVETRPRSRCEAEGTAALYTYVTSIRTHQVQSESCKRSPGCQPLIHSSIWPRGLGGHMFQAKASRSKFAPSPTPKQSARGRRRIVDA